MKIYLVFDWFLCDAVQKKVIDLQVDLYGHGNENHELLLLNVKTIKLESYL